MSQGVLYLDSGQVFEGVSVGEFETAGELVFNTAHSGYEEVFSDPSYYNQIIVMTAPMQGNYGLPDKEALQSKNFWASGLVCLSLQDTPRCDTWKQALLSRQRSILSEVDTRAIVLESRQNSELYGALVQKNGNWQTRAQDLIDNIKKSPAGNWPNEVSLGGGQLKGTGSNFKIAVMDFGCKQGLLNQMLTRASEVCVFKSTVTAQEVLAWKPDMVLLSNGPGDPKTFEEGFNLTKNLIGKIPLLGVCLGHQLLSRAMGAEVYKMPFGHHGVNHSIEDRLLNQVYMSSQNHCYAVKKESLDATELEISHVNLIDHTVAGVFSKTKKCLGLQMHPESSPGPSECEKNFDYFVNLVKEGAV